MKYQIWLILAIGIFVSACSIRMDADLNKVPTWLQGDWKGVGYQINYPQTWTMELEAGKDVVSISYPTLKCSGDWILKSVSGDRVEFVEKITIGQDKCVQGGRVVITMVDDHFISYSYFNPDSGELEAHSTLQNTKSKDVIKS